MVLKDFYIKHGVGEPIPVEADDSKTIAHLVREAQKAFALMDVSRARLFITSEEVRLRGDKNLAELPFIPTYLQPFNLEVSDAVASSVAVPVSTGMSPPGTPLSEDQWELQVTKLETEFFAPGSANYLKLVEFVQHGAQFPTTDGTLSGLPFVTPRVGLPKDRPSLLFLNLPESSGIQDSPSTADKALEKINGRRIPLLPMFGVSGCGKTRTAMEMLCKNWGFYFNGSDTDWGSQDLVHLLEMVKQRKRYQNGNLESNTHIHILALTLVLSRVIILQHCLNIAESKETPFTCKNWMLLQVGFNTLGFKDLFSLLFAALGHMIHRYHAEITVMTFFVGQRFSQLHTRLLNLTFYAPSQNVGLKILLVIDEAQNLGKMEFGTFISQQTSSEPEQQNNKRPILSPFVHGLYQIVPDNSQFCVVTCGTGLSILDMNWLEDSAPVAKGYKDQLGPFTDFPGWESLEQIQNYVALVRRSFPNDQLKGIFDTRVPEEAVLDLFTRLRGRFRPIVTAIESMICAKDQGDWKKSITDTEEALTSTDGQSCGKGNIPYDIHRMICEVAQHPVRYKEYQNVRTVLQFFVLEYYLHGSPVVLHELEAPLVEASVGRILSAHGQRKSTVMDEPFVLYAAVNYFRKFDPDFHSTICSLFSGSRKPSVYGSTWEMAVLPSLAHVFHNKVLDKTSLIPADAVRSNEDNFLSSKATIVGYDPNGAILGTDHRKMTLSQFLEAHIRKGSFLNGEKVPAFYCPAETPSGPDIVCVLYFDNYGFCPAFFQQKLKSSMDRSDILSAWATVSAKAVNDHLDNIQLETFCTIVPPTFLGIVIAYPTELPGVEGTFTKLRRSERTCSAPKCIMLKVDKNNIGKLFPEAHVKVLDCLKNVKQGLKHSGEDMQGELTAKHRRL